METLRVLTQAMREHPRVLRTGRVASVAAEQVEAVGLGPVGLGARVRIEQNGREIVGEVVANDGVGVKLACYQPIDGLAPGARVVLIDQAQLRPSQDWLGRIVDAFGQPLDGKGPMPVGPVAFPARRPAPPAAQRAHMGQKLVTGIHALDIFAPLCAGQRVGLFAGSGVGKSVLMGMITARANADAFVFAMVGERGREVRSFIDDLPEAARARTCVVVATSDQPAIARREAAYCATAIAEALSAEGKHVLLVMDSVTRFAIAGREIGLAAGEPPSVRGYPPSVFADLPRLLERTGPPIGQNGPITAIYTVLVEGGDHDEPIADAVRGILDGHIVMTRSIAERGRLPAIDVLKSVSRSLPRAHLDTENQLMREARALMADLADVDEIVRLGAYEHGSNLRTDRAIRICPGIEAFLTQSPQSQSHPAPFQYLADLLDEQTPDAASEPQPSQTGSMLSEVN